MKLHGLFVSSTGNHCILSFMSDGLPIGNFYLNFSGKTLHPIMSLKNNCLVTSVGWNRHVEDSSTTGNILIGDSDGNIYEMEIQMDTRRQKPSERSFQFWYRVSDEQGGAINSIKVDRFDNQSKLNFILFSTKRYS